MPDGKSRRLDVKEYNNDKLKSTQAKEIDRAREHADSAQKFGVKIARAYAGARVKERAGSYAFFAIYLL